MERFALGILRYNDETLAQLHKRDRCSNSGIWDLVGDYCRPEENFLDALIRELKKELGVLPIKYDLLYHRKETDQEMQIFIVDL